MKNTTKVLFAGILGLGLAVGGIVSANSDKLTTHQSHMDGLVTAIAERFNLNEKDVEQVFTEQLMQHRSEAGGEHFKGRSHGMKMAH